MSTPRAFICLDFDNNNPDKDLFAIDVRKELYVTESPNEYVSLNNWARRQTKPSPKIKNIDQL